ncbi:hypothetical protein B0H13DRAFT_2156397, partial [Mycena leptocephala]
NGSSAVLFLHILILLPHFLSSFSSVIPFRRRLSVRFNTAFSFTTAQLTYAQSFLDSTQLSAVAASTRFLSGREAT